MQENETSIEISSAKNAERKSLLFSEAILVALVPAAAYSLTYCFQYGYSKTLGIPSELIEFNLLEFLNVAFSVVGTIWILFNFLGIFLPAVISAHKAIKSRVVFIFACFFYSVAALILFGREWKVWIWMFGGSVILGVLVLGWPLWKNRKNLNEFFESLQKKAQTQTSGKKDLYDLIRSSIGREAYLAISVFVIVAYFFYFSGMSRASEQTDYTVISTEPESVVLAIYGNEMICANFDRQEKTISGDFVIRETDDVQELTFHKEDVGPLKLVSKYTKVINKK
jgi:hypothetical protein